MARHKVYPLIVALSIAGSIAMGGCGSSTRVCNEAGCCGAGGDLCVAPRYLLADGHDGQVSIFPIDGTGALGTPTSVKGASMSLGMAAVNNQFVYVSDSQLGGMGLIDEWSLNLGTGALTPLQQSPFSLGTTSLTAGLAADNSIGILYVADAGKIDVLKVDATGTLSAVTGSPVPAGTNLYLTVDPQSRFVFASEDDLPGSVAAFTIDLASGALTPVQARRSRLFRTR
jgi:3-carboxymuconate cyclase